LAFNGFDFTAAASPRGGRFRLLGLDGWLSRAQRRDRQDKMGQSGAWESTGVDASLPITAQGTATYADAASAARERRELLALGGGGQYPMTVVDALGEGTRTVEVDSLVASPVRDAAFSWSLVVTACDPLLYGPATFGSTTLAAAAGGAGRVWPRVWPTDWGVPPGVTPGAIALANDGTASYFPRLRIDGPVPNPVVSMVETGDQITYSGTVPVGQFLDVDCARRRVMLAARSNPTAGVSMRHLVSSVGNWCAVPVGGGSLLWKGDAADPAATQSAWGNEGANE
jgi:hypothetical protein